MSDSAPTVVFLSYAVQDASVLGALREQFLPFEASGALALWTRERIPPGTTWQQQMQLGLGRGRAAVILLSADYLADKDLLRERQQLIAAADRGDLVLHLLLVRACVYDVVSDLAGREMVNRQPLSEMGRAQADRALADLARQIATPGHLSEPEPRRNSDRGQVRIGVITALPKEYAAMKTMLDTSFDLSRPGGARYLCGSIPALSGGTHSVVLSLLPTMANNIAATRAAQLLADFPSVHDIIMCGIAGGVPNPDRAEEHVRLGDIVVSGEHGVTQYDLLKDSLSGREMVHEVTHRSPPRPPSSVLLEAVRLLEAEELTGHRPWRPFIARAIGLSGTARPPEEKDLLGATPPRDGWIPHPADSARIPGEPRVFIGKIASANILLRNAVRRDELRRQGVRAVEMEGSGIADATWTHGTGYLVVRGICDYCDEHKNDDWQGHAAVVAAAYVRALISSMPGLSAGSIK